MICAGSNSGSWTGLNLHIKEMPQVEAFSPTDDLVQFSRVQPEIEDGERL